MNILSAGGTGASAVLVDRVHPLAALALLAWIIWWLCLVDWGAIRVVLKQGGWIALALLGVLASLVWSNLVPSDDRVLPIDLPGFLDKFTVVFALYVMMFGCGALQMAIRAPEEA